MERIEFAGHRGVRLVADAVGPADGLPVIFLHGGGQTRQSWGKAVREAGARGLRALALDLRGHGESGWAPDADYGIDAFADDVRAVIAALGRPPVLVGASLGGMTALVVAADQPSPVAGLVLVDIAVRIEPEGTREIGDFMMSAPNGFANLEEAADAVAAYLPHRPRPKDTSGLMRNLRLREDGRLHWHWDPAFIRRRPKEAEAGAGARKLPTYATDLETAARRLTVPTLLVRGGRSRVVTHDGAMHFLELVPHARYADVAGADHMVAGDANDAFNAVVMDFLAGIAG
ncbi:alpha/beta fold hydrolase [Novosphingobium bradum]|uniref:Alpha/beta fold hydrolase n=1 Tax=Novosphingobium bradum TaxID=1737444 RepID=A0ABV7ILU3_9SPHN